MTIHEELREQDHASTQKTSAILIAGLAGLWLGLAGAVSASVESGKVPVQSRPSTEDCGGFSPTTNIVDLGWEFISKYYFQENVDYSLDEFKTDMNGLLTSPELINCQDGNRQTIAHVMVSVMDINLAVADPVEVARWVVSKGIDLTITYDGFTAYDHAREIAAAIPSFSSTKSAKLNDPEKYKRRIKWGEILVHQVAPIFKPPPAPATKPCSEVDGQTPPANEYCIVAENVQSSRKIPIWTDLEKRLAGGNDYKYEVHRSMSGTGLYPGWKAEITFTCSSAASPVCGYADYAYEERFGLEWLKVFKKRWGINVFCGESGDLLDLDRDLEPGESISVTHSSDTERHSPRYMHCSANALDPFTLSIKTTRLAQ